MEYPARTSKRSEPDNAAGRGQEAHAGRAANLLQARIACISHRPQLVQRIYCRFVQCFVFWIGRGFLVREPDFTDRLFDLSGSVPCFQRLNRKIGDGNAVVLTELVLDKHPSKLLQNALLPACRLGGGIRAPQKVAVWNFGSRYRNQLDAFIHVHSIDSLPSAGRISLGNVRIDFRPASTALLLFHDSALLLRWDFTLLYHKPSSKPTAGGHRKKNFGSGY